MVDGYRGEGGEDMVQLTVAYCMKGYHIYIHIMDDEKIGIKSEILLIRCERPTDGEIPQDTDIKLIVVIKYVTAQIEE